MRWPCPWCPAARRRTRRCFSFRHPSSDKTPLVILRGRRRLILDEVVLCPRHLIPTVFPFSQVGTSVLILQTEKMRVVWSHRVHALGIENSVLQTVELLLLFLSPQRPENVEGMAGVPRAPKGLHNLTNDILNNATQQGSWEPGQHPSVLYPMEPLAGDTPEDPARLGQ